MPTLCSAGQLEFEALGSRKVIASFDGGAITSNAGALLLRQSDRRIGLTRQAAACFKDGRDQELVEHSLETLIAQRVHGIALGYEDLNDHDKLRHDPVLGLISGKLTARRSGCAVLAGKSTLNRLEHAPSSDNDRYRKIGVDEDAMKDLFVSLFIQAHRTAPGRLILDLDATDDPIHGDQEGRFFHGYYKCYCYLPDAKRASRFCTSTFRIGCLGPCVDGSRLSRGYRTGAASVGAALCSAFSCGLT